MNNKTNTIEDLKKAMEFYQAMGFEYLPVKIKSTEYSQSDPSRRPASGIKNTEHIATSKDKNTEAQKNINAEVQKGGRAEDRQRVSEEESVSNFQASELKASALKALREEIGNCQRCKLCGNRRHIVFGEGFPEAELMFIGEGPGRDEDIQGRPFVGEAGKLLTNLIVKLDMKREDVYIANIVKCRPPNNREPEEDEVELCRPFVEKQIEIIKPKVIVSLGKVSTHALLRIKIPISKVRGNFIDYGGIPVMPTFHPAYLLRNKNDKWKTWDDMQKVLEKLKS